MIAESLKIIELQDLLKQNLAIPNYQRPYRWTTESASILFNDLYSSFKNNVPEYRIGSVVLHEDEGKLFIVDGQQRLTTISILIYCFFQNTKNPDYEKLSTLLFEKEMFGELSFEAISSNNQIFDKKFKDVPDIEKDKFIKYVLTQCTFVRIVTNNEQEAFQFFDSQNSRGKPLAPHDLLKSYHLRAMFDELETVKVKTVSDWENEDQKQLALFFKNHLYPLGQYYTGGNGLYYSSKKIKTFKGISPKNKYHFSVYHKAANLYIEHFNSEGMYELSSGEKVKQFQLTQPLIAGKRFFQYTLYYYDLYKKILSLLDSNLDAFWMPTNGSGNTYIKNMFINILIFFVDKFNADELTLARIKFFYKWAYSLRIVTYSVYPETVSKYCLGYHDRANVGLNLFSYIHSTQTPEELDSIVLDSFSNEEYTKLKSDNQKYFWNIINGENF